MPLVEQWWKDSINSESYLRSTPATERVKLINDKLLNVSRANLVPAAGIGPATPALGRRRSIH